jgi:hypothetical protein
MLLSDESLFQTLTTLYTDVADIRSWMMQLQNTTLLNNCKLLTITVEKQVSFCTVLSSLQQAFTLTLADFYIFL